MFFINNPVGNYKQLKQSLMKIEEILSGTTEYLRNLTYLKIMGLGWTSLNHQHGPQNASKPGNLRLSPKTLMSGCLPCIQGLSTYSDANSKHLGDVSSYQTSNCSKGQLKGRILRTIHYIHYPKYSPFLSQWNRGNPCDSVEELGGIFKHVGDIGEKSVVTSPMKSFMMIPLLWVPGHSSQGRSFNHHLGTAKSLQTWNRELFWNCYHDLLRLCCNKYVGSFKKIWTPKLMGVQFKYVGIESNTCRIWR